MRGGQTNFNGFLNINKPPGITSFEALGSVKKIFSTGKVGHAGTLDRFASGVLVALVGRYARLSGYFTASRKTYLAGIRFGSETDTLDPEGRIVAQAPCPSSVALRAALPSFIGDVQQSPPAFSAVHIDGKRAYERALQGEDVNPAPRPVTIYSLDLLEYADGQGLLRVECSKGTYIRSLARDIALACGSRAHLETLVREASGPFRVEDGVRPEETTDTCIRTLDPELSKSINLPPVFLNPGQETYFLRGAPITLGRFRLTPDEDGVYGVFTNDAVFLGVVERKDGWFTYRVVLGSV